MKTLIHFSTRKKDTLNALCSTYGPCIHIYIYIQGVSALRPLYAKYVLKILVDTSYICGVRKNIRCLLIFVGRQRLREAWCSWQVLASLCFEQDATPETVKYQVHHY